MRGPGGQRRREGPGQRGGRPYARHRGSGVGPAPADGHGVRASVSTELMKIAIAGQGAFGTQHVKALQNIPGIEVISLTGGRPAGTQEFATAWKIPHWTTDLSETLKQPGLEAVIIASPTQIHAKQAEQCMRAGKHVLIEIPIADSVEDSERLVDVQKQTGVVDMAGDVRRVYFRHQCMLLSV